MSGNSTDVPLNGAVQVNEIYAGGDLRAGANGTRLHITLSELLGGVLFDRQYTILNASGTTLQLTSAQVAEASPTEIISFGTYRDPITLSEGFFVVKLGPDGTWISGAAYKWSVPGVTDLAFRGIFDAGLSGYFLVGEARYSGPGGTGISAMAAHFDASGANVWAKIYPSIPGDVSRGADVEFFNLTELYMVGTITSNGSTHPDGFMLRLNPATGMPMGPINRYGGSDTDEFFTGITSSTSTTVGGTTGLLISGSSNARVAFPQNFDSWLVKLSTSGVILASFLYDYSPTANLDNYGEDVLERRHPLSGVYSIFLGGHVTGGAFGGQDMHVVKTNNSFTSTGNWTYGTSSNEYAIRLLKQDFVPVGTSSGLKIVGTIEYAPGVHYSALYKTYFNGVTFCNRGQSVPNTFGGPIARSTGQCSGILNLSPETIVLGTYSVASSYIICWGFSIPGGSNAKNEESADSPNDEVRIYSLPGTRDLSAIQIESSMEGTAEVSVTDLRGAVIFRAQIELNEGVNSLPSQAALPAGVVVVKVITDEGGVWSEKVLIF